MIYLTVVSFYRIQTQTLMDVYLPAGHKEKRDQNRRDGLEKFSECTIRRGVIIGSAVMA